MSLFAVPKQQTSTSRTLQLLVTLINGDETYAAHLIFKQQPVIIWNY